MASGRFQPCQRARLYDGSCPPTTGPAAAFRMGPMIVAGSTPTARQSTTSSSTGTRIQCTGSCGSRGRSEARRPKNTSTAKRSA